MMGNILHDWGTETKQQLIAKAYAALPPGGAFIAIEERHDGARRQNAFGLLMSLNMLIETPEGYDYTFAQFDGWCRKAGFCSTETFPLSGPASAVVAWKESGSHGTNPSSVDRPDAIVDCPRAVPASARLEALI